MKPWYETPLANIGLRIGGLFLLAASWWCALRLPHAQGDIARLMLAAAVFLNASAGSALLWEGAGLWEPVEVSERWQHPKV